MRYWLRNSIVGKALVVWGFACVFGALCCGADYAVHVVEPAVTNHMILPEGPLPPVCKESTTIGLSACRGEYEPASFVVTASKPLEGVRIEVGQLSGPGGQWPEDAVDVRVVKDYWRGTMGGGAAAVPTLLVHDESFLAIEPAPDDPNGMTNVARGELRDAPELLPVRIERRKHFWVTVHVPENAEPGTYRTTVRIVPQNSGPSEMTLQVLVYPFTLLPPMLEYSMYYPAYVSRDLPKDNRYSFGDRTEQQYLAEMKNMLAHGLTNPNICEGPVVRPDGTLDFSPLARVLDLRESVGMRPKALYLSNMADGCGHPLPFTADRPLTPDERQQTHRYVPEINAWARARDYEEVFYMAIDERWGEELTRERDSMIAVGEAGGQVFVAVMQTPFFERVGDVLHRPVLLATGGAHLYAAGKKYGPEESLRHMDEIAKAGTFERMRTDEGFRKAIDGVHRLGNKILTYMNPTAGVPLPEYQRRNEGLGLWRVGFDGTKTWAYTNLQGDEVNQPLIYGKVFRTVDGVLDTLYWEGWREGVDDVRYLTTLVDTLTRGRGRFPGEPLVSETDDWIDGFDVADGDLDAIRREMARRIIALSDLGYKELPPEEALAGIDLERVQLIAFPEPWRFKMDPEDQGIRERWFDPAVDDSGWGTMRTDTKDKGWGTTPGFGWYRAELPLTPQDAGRKFKYLYFGACDEDSWVYLNGEPIFEHSVETTGLLPDEIWLTAFVVPFGDVRVRGRDLLAVRVHNSGGMGGIWKPVRLVLSDQKLTKQQIEALIELETAKD